MGDPRQKASGARSVRWCAAFGRSTSWWSSARRGGSAWKRSAWGLTAAAFCQVVVGGEADLPIQMEVF